VAESLDPPSALVTRTPLRRRLLLLTAAGILPLALLAGFGLYVIERQHELQAERVGLELARSVATSVDAELRTSLAMLEALSTSPTLDEDDFVQFAERAARLLTLRTEWTAIVLSERDGRTVVDTRLRGDRPAVEDPESFARVVATAQPTVGSLVRIDGEWLFPVRAPAVRDGMVQFVVTALVEPAGIYQLLATMDLPEGWLISIVDAQGLRVARSIAHEENLGGRLSPSAQDIVDRGGPEGTGVSTSLEGERIYTPFSRLPMAGWVAVLGIPTEMIEAAVIRSLGLYSIGVLMSFALAALCALWVARTITGPIGHLRAAAEAVGRRGPVTPPDTSILEIHEVGTALAAAAAERDRVETQREELLLKERAARELAENADRAKEQFMAILSHELRTPLNAVYGWAKMLQSGQMQDEALVARAKDAIVRNADIQVQLIDDLLDFSRITSGKMRLDIRSVDPSDVVKGAVDAVRPAAVTRNIRIQTTIEPAVGTVAGDPARLQQVVWNLLMNAVKFTPSGGLVDVELRRDHDGVHVTVRDTGQGIAPEILPHIFERFRQADSSSTRAHGGLGLGLALVKHLVELHGGRVVAQSAGAGRGATFTVTLPAAAAAGIRQETPLLTPPNAIAVAASAGVARLDGLRVLVSDDDREALTLAEAIVRGAGAQVRTSTTAADTLDILRSWRPDVLVSDIEMPGEDGYSLIRKVRDLPAAEGGATPAIALTAYGRPEDRARSLAGGFNMHVPKPVDPGELTAIIADVAGQPLARRA